LVKSTPWLLYFGPPINLAARFCVASAFTEELVHESFEKVGDCFYVDGVGNTYFSVEDFMREHRLPDSPRLRRAVIELAQEEFPDIRILEEWN